MRTNPGVHAASSPRRPRILNLVIAAFCSAVFLAGCKPRASTSARPDTLIFARGSDSQKLDPADVDDGESVNVLAQICEGLLRFKSGTLELEPCLAESYSISPDGLRYTFHLRPGVRFHDGTPLDAKAALWSFERQMDPKHPGHLPEASFEYWGDLYQDIDRARAVDAMTLEFDLKKPNASLLSSLAIFPAYLVSPNALAEHGADFQRWPVGTGAYRFVSWTPNQAIVLEANPAYWDKSRPPGFKRLVIKVVPENAVRLLELKAGNIQGLDGVQPAELAAVASDPRFKIYRQTGLNVGYLTFNLNVPRFRDPEVRLAFALAIDRAKLASLAQGNPDRAAACPLPPGMLGYPRTPDPIPHDPARAREIIARHAAEFSTPVKLQVMTAPRPFFPDPVKVASFIRAQLEAVGVTVEIEALDFKSHLDRLRRFDYECGLIGWVGDNGDPDNFLTIFFASWATDPGTAQNYACYKNPEMDALLLQGRRTIDPAARAAIYERAIALWRRDLPILPLVYGDTIAVMRREVTGFAIQKTSDLQLAGTGWNERAE